jgi:hypothetical protein
MKSGSMSIFKKQEGELLYRICPEINLDSDECALILS